MKRLLINRIPLTFNVSGPVSLVARKTEGVSLSKNHAGWIRDKLSSLQREQFVEWMKRLEVNDRDVIATEFHHQISIAQGECISVELIGGDINPFKREIFKQELGKHLQSKQFFVEPIRKSMSFSAYQNMGQFDQGYDHQYRRIDFDWKPNRNELSFNFGSERTLITNAVTAVADDQAALSADNYFVYKRHGGIEAKCFCPEEVRRQKLDAPQKFNYRDRFEKLKDFAANHLYDLSSPFFSIDRTGFKYVDPDGFHNVFSQQNLMAFGGEKTAINAVVGMREYGPLKKADNSERKRLLFIYQNRNDANTLYRYLKNGLKHFPGLLSYVGIPVALAGPDKGLPYQDVNSLPKTLSEFLETHYPNSLYPDMLAVVIGPFKRYESDEEESASYFQIKKILLDKGIASQFISHDTINNYGFHYSLPNIAIAILAKFGGVPWKLSKKKSNELIVGFNTKLVEGDRYLGSAVFFDNEGRLGGVKGLPIDDKTAIIRSLKDAIAEYTSHVGMPERLIIHYYKPPSKDEISNIQKMLEDLSLSVPVAVVEVNDSKSKMDICFDADFNMGMPESGVFVKIGKDEYLLFNNNRYKKSPPQKIDDELPIKLKLSFVNTGGFTTHELIAQVYEFSRLNWKGLRQRSVPVTTTYSKTIAEFSSHFEGEIPSNDVANNVPWFI